MQSSSIDPVAIGCGSISQVYQAVTSEHEKVALKIVLPGMSDILQTDFKIMRTLLPVARWLIPDVPLVDFYEEIEGHLLNETDLLAEARSLNSLKSRFSQYSDIHLPEVFSEISTKTALCMSLESGKTLSDFIETATQEERDRAGRAIVRFVVTSVKEKFFNSDPHPGNFIFNGPRVTFLDFGNIVSWDEKTSEAWNSLILSFLYYDRELFEEGLRKVNGISPRARKADIQKTLDFFAKPRDGFWNTGKVSTLDPHLPVKQLQELFQIYSSYHMPIRLHPKFVLGLRVYLGHLNVVGQIGARSNWKELVEEIFSDQPIKRADSNNQLAI